MTDISTAMQTEMQALAQRESPMYVFAGRQFLYWWTKERARADAIEAALARLPRWADRRRIKREGNRAFKKMRPDWSPVPSSLPQIDRARPSWWKNAAAH